MKALVTGGGGFIGSHVVRALLARGAEVRVLHLPSEDLVNLRGLDVDRAPGDVTDVATVRAAVKGCDAVFHLAAIYALWSPRPERMWAVNVDGTRNVLRAAGDAGARVVHTSSIAVFGGQGPGRDATEESPFRLGATGDPYPLSKLEAHRVAEGFARDGLDVTIVAPCGPIGPGDVGPTPTGRLLLSALTLPLPLVIDSETSFADVRDMARGHLLAFDRGRRGESYLLGGPNLSMRALARMALRIADRRRPVVAVPAVIAEAAAHPLLWYTDHVSRRAPLFTPRAVAMGRLGLRADCSKAARELGLSPSPIEHAVRDALAWFAANGRIRDRRIVRRLLDGAR